MQHYAIFNYGNQYKVFLAISEKEANLVSRVL